MRSLAAIASLLAVLGACDSSPTEAAEIAPLLIELPDLSRLEATVRSQIEQSSSRLQSLSTRAGGDIATLAEAYGELGALLLAYRYESFARPALAEANRLVPEEGRWAYWLGHLESEAGDFTRAEEWFERAAEAGSDTAAGVLARLGEVRFRLDRTETARRALEEAWRNDPACALAAHLLGLVSAREGNLEASVDWHLRALAADPAAGRVHEPLALAYRDLGDLESAKRHLAASSPGKPACEDPWRDRLEEIKTGFRAHLLQGSKATLEGRHSDAIASFREAVATAPQEVVGRINLGSALIAVGDLAGAEREYREATRLDPGSIEAQFNLGVVLTRQGRAEEALRAYDRALTMNPQHPAALLNSANALRRQGRFDLAAVRYRKFLDGDSLHREAHIGAILCLQQLGRFVEAMREVEIGRAQNPRDRILMQIHVRLLAASPEPSVRNGVEARRLAERLVAAGRRLDDVIALAMALAETGEYAAALELQESAIAASARAGRADLLPALQTLAAAYRRGEPSRSPFLGLTVN